MAETVLFNIADGIIAKLGSIAVKEIAMWWGVNDEMEKLKSTVLTIKNVLLDAEKRSWQKDEIKRWLGDLKEAVYDADDLLDDFSTEVLRRQVMEGNKMAREYVSLDNCPNLKGWCRKSIVEAELLKFPCFSYLGISSCPQLSERCNNVDEDWQKIAHIPTIVIDHILIQLNGHYQL